MALQTVAATLSPTPTKLGSIPHPELRMNKSPADADSNSDGSNKASTIGECHTRAMCTPSPWDEKHTMEYYSPIPELDPNVVCVASLDEGVISKTGHPFVHSRV